MTPVKITPPDEPQPLCDPRKINWVLANYDIDLLPFTIYGSLVKTLDEAEKKLFDHGNLIRCYHFLTEDDRLTLPLNACRSAILGHIQEVWYEVSGKEVPAKVTQNQEERMAKAKSTTAQEETEGSAPATKEPRITNRSIIESGLLAGKSEEDIMAEVKARFPNGKADAKHIAYYRHYLVKNGQLEKQERKPRAKKAAAEGTEQAPEAAKVSAKAGAAKAAPAQVGGPKPGRESKSTAKAGK